jgi:hypothetical protein
VTTATGEVLSDADQYLKDVAPHLDVLPDAERVELLDDLAQHLREIAAEPGPPLRERLGPPEAYAAELLASAGVATEARPRRGLRAQAVAFRRRLAGTAVGREAIRLRPVLQPAWWVLRAYLAVALVTAFEQGTSYPGFPLPRPFGSSIIGLLAIVAAIPLSVRLGQRRPQARTGRLLAVAANAALVVFALVLAGRTGEPAVQYVPVGGPVGWQADGCLRTADGGRITNLYAYDAEGRLLDPVLLYDQNGQPVDDLCPQFDDRGRPLSTEYRQDVNGAPVINAFPRRQTVLEAPGSTVPVRPPAVVVPRLTSTTIATATTTPSSPSG